MSVMGRGLILITIILFNYIDWQNSKKFKCNEAVTVNISNDKSKGN